MATGRSESPARRSLGRASSLAGGTSE